MNYSTAVLALLIFFFSLEGYSQHESTLPSSEKEEADELKGLAKVIDFLTIETNKRRAAQNDSLYPSKLVFAPYVLYYPETNFGFGVGGSYLFKMKNSGDESRTRTSIIPIAFTYTLENQLFFYSGFEIFSPDERYVISGNMRAQVFPRLFYGVGRNTPIENEVVFGSTQLIFEPILTKQVFIDKLFIGGGVRYRKVMRAGFRNQDESDENLPVGLELDEISGAFGSTSVGAEFALLYDTRNSLLNPQYGSYLEFTRGGYEKVLGGTHSFNLTRADFRQFFLLKGTEDWRDVLALNVRGYFSGGDVPLVELGQLGSGEIMRGFYEGRYVDRNYVAAQAEYRLNIKDFPVGFVGFASVGDVAPKISSFTLENLRPAGGMGIRYEIDKKERLNIRADVALTPDDFNFYIQIGEAF